MIIDHRDIIEDLKNLSQKKELAHGYIFFGQPRVGKKSVALGLAGFLEGKEFEQPKFLNDSLLIEPGAEGSIGIEEVRKIKNFLWRKPTLSAYRTAIIDNSEFLTNEAQNALLKITEEPPSSSLIILIVVDPEKILPTISSRLQKIYFSAVPADLIKTWAEKELGCGKSEAERLSHNSFGQPGLAWQMSRDKNFEEVREWAKRFLQGKHLSDPNFVKEITGQDDFNFRNFLDVLLLELSLLKKSSEMVVLWHKLVNLRRQVDFFNLNPRLQLESLLYEK